MTPLSSFPIYHLLLFDFDPRYYFKCQLKSSFAPFLVSLHLFLSAIIDKILLQATDHRKDVISMSYKNNT